MLDPQELIDPLYEAFAANPAPRRIECSPAESDAERQSYDQLLATPLREAPPEMIGPYASSALYTVGDVDDYRHFLPRILEIALFEQGWTGFEPWAIANKLVYGGWLSWSKREVEILRCYFAAGFEQAAARPVGVFSEFESWLVAILTLGEDARSQLKFAISIGKGHTVGSLARIIVDHQKRLIRDSDFGDSIWDSVPEEERAAVIRFIRSKAMQDLLIEYGLGANEDDRFMLFDPALNIVEQL
ncbi:MAG: hypothetical protein AAGE86_03125 [Pseudomonadota bacterium]